MRGRAREDRSAKLHGSSLVGPVLVRQRRGIQLIPMLTPAGQVPVHQGHESIGVTSFKQVYKLVDDEILEAALGFLCKLQVQPNAMRLGVA